MCVRGQVPCCNGRGLSEGAMLVFQQAQRNAAGVLSGTSMAVLACPLHICTMHLARLQQLSAVMKCLDNYSYKKAAQAQAKKPAHVV